MIWEVETSDGDVRFYVSQFEADSAAKDAVARGLSARVAPIPIPRSGSALCDLLTHQRDKYCATKRS